jgi:hypothetical protein
LTFSSCISHIFTLLLGIRLDKHVFAPKLKYMVFITNNFGGDLFAKELGTTLRIPEEA